MTPLEQILFISLVIVIIQWSVVFLADIIFFGGYLFKGRKNFIIQNSIMSLGFIVCIIIAWIIGIGVDLKW